MNEQTVPERGSDEWHRKMDAMEQVFLAWLVVESGLDPSEATTMLCSIIAKILVAQIPKEQTEARKEAIASFNEVIGKLVAVEDMEESDA